MSATDNNTDDKNNIEKIDTNDSPKSQTDSSNITKVKDDVPGYDYLFRICLMGDPYVGKTSLLTRFTDGSFKDSYNNTIGVDFRVATLKYKDKIIKMHIWDTAGQERFKAITSTYLRSCNGFIFVYDITDKATFSNINNWIQMVSQNNKSGDFSFLVGNKNDRDKERVVTTREGENLARQNKYVFYETSAKANKNVDEMFYFFALKLVEDYDKNKSKYDEGKKDKLYLGLSGKDISSVGTRRDIDRCKC